MRGSARGGAGCTSRGAHAARRKVHRIRALRIGLCVRSKDRVARKGKPQPSTVAECGALGDRSAMPSMG